MILTTPEVIVAQTSNFVNVSSLSLSNLNITESNGNNNNNIKTEDSLAAATIKGLSQLCHLQKLELKNSNLIGCFQKILPALQRPLEYLSISGSAVSPSDLRAFKTWKFANMLKDLNVSDLVTSEEDTKCLDLRVSDLPIQETQPTTLNHSNDIEESQNKRPTNDSLVLSLIDMIKYLSSLVVLDTYGNHMSRENFSKLGNTISEHLKELKMLRLNDTLVSKDTTSYPDDDHILKLVAQLKDHLSFQMLYVTRACRCVNNETCSTECKIAFWSKLDNIIGSVPVKIAVEMK